MEEYENRVTVDHQNNESQEFACRPSSINAELKTSLPSVITNDDAVVKEEIEDSIEKEVAECVSRCIDQINYDYCKLESIIESDTSIIENKCTEIACMEKSDHIPIIVTNEMKSEELPLLSADFSNDFRNDITQQITINIEDNNRCGVCKRVAIGESEKLSPHGQVFKFDEDSFWIACEQCNRWFHGSCVDVEELEDFLIDTYHCSSCVVDHGPTKMKECVAPHRFNCFDPNEEGKPVEVGSKAWIQEFSKTEFEIPPPTEDYVIYCENGHDFESKFDRDNIWEKIYLIKVKDGLRLQMPKEEFTVDSLISIFGSNYVVDTIDVYRQETFSMRLGSFCKKFNSSDRDRIYNFLSLEFSKTDEMRTFVVPPVLVNEISFVHKIWPDQYDPVNWEPTFDFRIEKCDATLAQKADNLKQNHTLTKPDVALFCLCGMSGSYTDFHIDFGGSSVWYHIYRGKKIFYLIPPTHENLLIYEEYQKMENSSVVFLGNLYPPGVVRRAVINEGETLMIPSGWIHAVYTPVDSLVFGGNFLHHLNIDMQLRVYDLEQRVKRDVGLDDKFLFPHFEMVHFYAARGLLLEKIREMNEDATEAPEWLLKSLENLCAHMKDWVSRDRKDGSQISAFGDVVKKLQKQLDIQKKIFGTPKSPKKQKRKSGGGSSTDELYSNERPLKIRIKKHSPVTPSGAECSGQSADRVCIIPEPQTPTLEPIKMIISKKNTELEVKVPEIAENEQDSLDFKFFTGTSSRGRVKKPSALIRESAGETIAQEDVAPASCKRFTDIEWSADLEKCVKEEEDELLSKERQRKRQKKSSQSDFQVICKGANPPKKKAPSSCRQRLAKKLGF